MQNNSFSSICSMPANDLILLSFQFGSRAEGPAYRSHREIARWQNHGGFLQIFSFLNKRKFINLTIIRSPGAIHWLGCFITCSNRLPLRCNFQPNFRLIVELDVRLRETLTPPPAVRCSWWRAASSWLSRKCVLSASTWSTRTTGSCATCSSTWRSGGRWSS